MGFDLAAVRAENKRLESQGRSSFIENFVPMPEGEGSVVVRILPPKGDKNIPWCTTRTHKMNQKNFHCTQSLINGKWVGNCPICNYYKFLWRESDSASTDEANQLRAEARSIKPVERCYYNAIVRSITNKSGNVETNVGPRILSIGVQLHSKITRAIMGDPALDEPELGDITDTSGSTGRDLKIIKRLVKSGNESYPNYNESKFLAVSKAGTDTQIEEWMGNLHTLDDLRQLKSVEELSKEVRIHRGLEKDPNLDFDPQTMKEEIKVEIPKPVTKVVAPPSVEEDEDEAMPDDDFLNKLRSI